ncbi:MAG: transcriptional regulator, AraC family [Clostridia bacterium]|jgi:AraC-like DNA-binding protein|nr:transcriptional regulator, AraC family [Clostridia bacterium]
MRIIFDTDKLTAILTDYHEITGLRIGIYDINSNEIQAFPSKHCDFCKLIRTHSQGDLLCRSCDSEAYKKAKSANGIYLYSCHAGLVEAVAPIRENNMIIGYIMIGQMLYDSPLEEQWEKTLSCCKNLNVDLPKLKEAFTKLPRLSPAKIQATTRIMQVCSSYIWLDKLIKIQREPLTYQIESYISSHLEEPMTLESIAHDLGIGRTLLCQTVRANFNLSVTEMIRCKRLEKAKCLLDETDNSIAAIAYAVGIPDYNYFSRIFKQYIGVTPRAYRKSTT